MKSVFNQMKNFIDSLKISEPSQIPATILERFSKKFPDAYNCEWSVNCEIFEVIFYNQEQECIASFTKDACMTCIKRNLKLANTPELILNITGSEWELMNILEIEEGNNLSYECIVRDKELTRYVFYIDYVGNITKKEIL